MSRKVRQVLSWVIVSMMMAWSLGGLVMFPDAPIERCVAGRPYFYAYHPDGYCGKQGQPRTEVDFHRFLIWQKILFYGWAVGAGTAYILRPNEPKK